MKTCVNIKDIETLEFKEGVFWDTLIITFKSGNRKVIRKALDVSWELQDVYYDLRKQVKENEGNKFN
jgi:hypothetical protein